MRASLSALAIPFELMDAARSGVGALAGPLLHAANQGVAAVLERLDALTETLKTILFVTGSADLDQLEDHATLRYLPEEHA